MPNEPQQPNIAYFDGWRGAAMGCPLVGHFLPVAKLDLGAIGVYLLLCCLDF